MIANESVQPERPEGPESRPSYVVVLKGRSSVRLPRGRGARLLVTTDDGSAEVRVLTNWVESGLAYPLPRELWFDVRLRASSVDEAINQARVLVSVIAAVVAFSTNAEIGRIEPHLAFDATRGASERAFVEYFLPDERGLVPPSREGDPDVIAATAEAMFKSSHWKGISTSLAHYHAALGSYYVGGESLAVGHLFMAAEALREATLADYCKRSGRSEAQIMSDERHEERGHLLAWARRELIFAGDKFVYTRAKDASDGLEHGYRTVSEVRELAESVCDKVFEYVRRAIVDLLELPHTARDQLLDKFGTPADTQSLRRRVTGSLVGEGDELAIRDKEYPILEWNSSISHFDIAEDGSPKVQFSDRFTVRTAESIAFQLRSMEFYGRSRPGAELNELDIKIESGDEGAARDRILPVMEQLRRAVAACGPGEAGAEFPQPLSHLLELFNRTKGLFRAALSLLREALPEEALIIGRALLRDAMRLRQAASSDEAETTALAFGWRSDSAAVAADLRAEWVKEHQARRAEGSKLGELQSQIREAAQRYGVEPKSFAPTDELLSTLEDDDYANIDRLALAVEQGWDVATRSRRRPSASGDLGLYDTAPDSWVYPLAAKLVGGSYLIAAESAHQLFGWDDSDGQLAEGAKAVEKLTSARVTPDDEDDGSQ